VKLSLHSVILGEPLALADYVALASRCGYQGVDFGIGEIMSLDQDDPDAATQQVFSGQGIAPAAWGMPVEWRGSDEEFAAGLAQLPRQAEVAAAIGCPRCLTWVMDATKQQPEQLRAMIVPRFREIAQVLAEFGVRFGLEWCGPHCLPDEPGSNPFIWRMDQMLELIDEIGEPNVGLLVDSFHWFNAQHTVADLEALAPEQVVHVHINDAPDRPLYKQRDGEREVPGQGIIDLTGFVQALDKIGYSDYMAVEIFNEGLKQMPVEEAACQVGKATAQVINNALGPAG